MVFGMLYLQSQGCKYYDFVKQLISLYKRVRRFLENIKY
jgi:hypothetical protein